MGLCIWSEQYGDVQVKPSSSELGFGDQGVVSFAAVGSVLPDVHGTPDHGKSKMLTLFFGTGFMASFC